MLRMSRSQKRVFFTGLLVLIILHIFWSALHYMGARPPTSGKHAKEESRTIIWKTDEDLQVNGSKKIINGYLQDINNNYTDTKMDLLLVWSNSRAIPPQLETKIQEIFLSNSNRNITVFCGSKHCEDQINRVQLAGKFKNVAATRLFLRYLAKDTPLKNFVSESIYYRHKHGGRFLSYLHQVSVLLVLWNYGGLHLNLLYDIPSPIPDDFFIGEWISKSSMFLQSRFEKRSPFIERVMTETHIDYLKNENAKTWNIESLVFQMKQDSNLITKASPSEVLIKLPPRQNHYGMLCYTGRSHNLGDEMQSWAALQFLPYLDRCVDREDWSVSSIGNNPKQKTPTEKKKETVTMIINAWYGLETTWPPPPYVDPLLISMHMTKWFLQRSFLKKTNANYVHNKGLVGARDTFTVRSLLDNNVDSYLSGCATLLLENPFDKHERGQEIIVVDVDNSTLKEIVPHHIKTSLISISHVVRNNSWSLMEHVYSLIKRYARAKLVITSRLHCALPSVAMGTPVVFVQTDHLPGGSHYRLEGLSDLFHRVTTKGEGKTKTFSGLEGFDWDRPQPNPNGGKMMRLRATLWHEIQKRPDFRETAITFGIVPLNIPDAPLRNELIFSLLSWSSFLSLKERRSIESIFYHHPFAKVLIYSNTLGQSDVQLFTEVGYHVAVQNYTLGMMLDQLTQYDPNTFTEPIASFLEMVKSRETQHSNYDTTLMPLVLLYMHGGVFMKTNAILLKPISSLHNTIARQGNMTSELNEVVMKFEERSSFIRECILEYLVQIVTEDKMVTLPKLLAKTAARYPHQVFVVHAEKRSDTKEHALTMLGAEFARSINVANICQIYRYDKNREMSKWKEIVDHHTVVVVNNETQFPRSRLGTLCRYIFNTFCVFCGDII